MSELLRVTRQGGVIRIVEADFGVESTSSALNRLNHLGLDAFYQAGHVFQHRKKGVTDELKGLMEKYGVSQVQTRLSPLSYRAGTPLGQHFAEDMKLVFHTVLPFLRKWTVVPDDYETIYQQALVEMQQPDFVATWDVLTCWGIRGRFPSWPDEASPRQDFT